MWVELGPREDIPQGAPWALLQALLKALHKALHGSSEPTPFEARFLVWADSGGVLCGPILGPVLGVPLLHGMILG